jgi:hypothetical protein
MQEKSYRGTKTHCKGDRKSKIWQTQGQERNEKPRVDGSSGKGRVLQIISIFITSPTP